jgi:hypothetical protein
MTFANFAMLAHALPAALILIVALTVLYARNAKATSPPSRTAILSALLIITASFTGSIVGARWLNAQQPTQQQPTQQQPTQHQPVQQPARPAERTTPQSLATIYGGTQLYMNDSMPLTNFTSCTADGTPTGKPTSCSPSFCASVSVVISAPLTPSCPAPKSSPWSEVVAEAAKPANTACKQNTTHPFCTTAFLTSTFGGRKNGVAAAYCTDRYLIVIASLNTSYPHFLDNVPYPPTGDYNNGTHTKVLCQTRTFSMGADGNKMKYKIPLFPVPYPTASYSNNVNLASFPGGDCDSAGNCVAMTKTGTEYAECYYPTVLGITRGLGVVTAFSIDGQQIYAVFNNMGIVDAAQCNEDACTNHIGAGGGQPHAHGD